jgi:hypothetical protein
MPLSHWINSVLGHTDKTTNLKPRSGLNGPLTVGEGLGAIISGVAILLDDVNGVPNQPVGSWGLD